MNMKLKSTNVREQKLKNARATGVLSLREDGLKEFPSAILSLEKLKVLDLSCNAFKSVPLELCMLANLKKINLQDNKLGDIPDLSALGNCKTLNLDRNRLMALPSLPPGLKELTVGGNNLAAIPPAVLALAGTLVILDCSSNQVVELPVELCVFDKLEELVLDGNALAELPAEMGGLGKLKRLYLRNNRLSGLPAALLKDTPVNAMQLEGNLISKREFMASDGFEEFETRRTTLKKKDLDVAASMSGMNLCGLDD
jgi:leucine-rich repeat protein SHOC2